MMEFVQLVREMRQAQIEYFKNRSRDNLIKSKELEKKVDAELKFIQLRNQTK